MMKFWIKKHAQGSTLSLYIQPGSSRSQISGEHDGRLKIKIKAPPRDGEANECLMEVLSDLLGISKQGIRLIQGENSRQKLVLVELPPERVLSLLGLEGLIDKS